MFDIGAMELLVVAIIALVVVGPQDLPRLLKTVGGMVRKARDLASEFRMGVETLAAEAEREIDPFAEERKAEGLKPGMSPEEITEHIMGNRGGTEAHNSTSLTGKGETEQEVATDAKAETK